MRRTMVGAAFAALLLTPLHLPAQPDTSDTRLLQMPAVSRDHIAFVYADDLWISDRDGRNVRRLTSAPGLESHPVFSPDGRTIAYSAQNDAASLGGGAVGSNIYTIPAQGGEPTRLTWFPGRELVRGWTPDGRAVLFSSQSEVFSRGMKLFTVPAGGGFSSPLPVPSGTEASYSPDGASIAYSPYEDFTTQRKNYRGGAYLRIWILRLKDLAVAEIPQPAGHCNDANPRWMNGLVYFRSDRNGEFNLFSYDPQTREVRQLTHFDDFPVISLNAGGDRVVFEQAGFLHEFDVATGQSGRLKIGVAAELPETRPRFASGEGTGTEYVNTPGAHERSPVWSPDAKKIASEPLYGEERTLRAAWSPDSRWIAYTLGNLALYRTVHVYSLAEGASHALTDG